LKIKAITAFPIRIPHGHDVEEGKERPPVIDFGDYFVDEQAFTSIYSKHHETTVIKIETDTGVVGWGEAQSPVSVSILITVVSWCLE
jgi:L-alanine-DL-glutamate epimerase-like enolase superfamily enzyme